jgi:hypothetical protein
MGPIEGTLYVWISLLEKGRVITPTPQGWEGSLCLLLRYLPNPEGRMLNHQWVLIEGSLICMNIPFRKRDGSYAYSSRAVGGTSCLLLRSLRVLKGGY